MYAPASDLAKLRVGETKPAILKCDLASETAAQAAIKDVMTASELARDYVSHDLRQSILEDTEGHINFLETPLDLKETVDLRNYLRTQMNPASSLRRVLPMAAR